MLSEHRDIEVKALFRSTPATIGFLPNRLG